MTQYIDPAAMQKSQHPMLGAQTEVRSKEAIAKVQGQMFLAAQRPRDLDDTQLKIETACKRILFCQKALYAFSRGKSLVEGPSIRMAEMMARHYRNIEYGWQVMGVTHGVADVEAVCWDIENNVRAYRAIQVKLNRKANNSYKDIIDPRDQNEHIANYGQRTVRACILEIIPKYLEEHAISIVKATLNTDLKEKPLEDRVRDMLSLFKEIGVHKEHIEKRLGYTVDKMVVDDVRQYGSIYNVIKEGTKKREDFFEIKSSPSGTQGGPMDLGSKIEKQNGDNPGGTSEDKAREKLADKLEGGKKDTPTKKSTSSEQMSLDNQAQNPKPIK